MSRTVTPGPGTQGAPGRELVPGPVLFARFAYPPNALGYCGPADNLALLEYAAAGVADAGLGRLARGFAGAWPYLELIAHASGIPDPLDRRVVEAYWVGNRLLQGVGVSAVAGSVQDRFRRRTGAQFSQLIEGVLAGGLPHHSFHVFCVYPWVGLLGDDRKGGHALEVLDRCRIRWGRVTALDGDRAVVRCQALEWTGRQLRLGGPTLQDAVRSLDGAGVAPALRPGDWVALHWGWVCDRLSLRQLVTLRQYTAMHLDIANDIVDSPVGRRGIAPVLDEG